MSGLFGKPDVPKEDPKITRQREIEQQRAERDRIKSTQDQLQQETLARDNGLGVASLSILNNRRALTSLLGKG